MGKEGTAKFSSWKIEQMASDLANQRKLKPKQRVRETQEPNELFCRTSEWLRHWRHPPKVQVCAGLKRRGLFDDLYKKQSDPQFLSTTPCS